MVISEKKSNSMRFDKLSKSKQRLLNEIAINEFRKPIKQRKSASYLINQIE